LFFRRVVFFTEAKSPDNKGEPVHPGNDRCSFVPKNRPLRKDPPCLGAAGPLLMAISVCGARTDAARLRSMCRSIRQSRPSAWAPPWAWPDAGLRLPQTKQSRKVLFRAHWGKPHE